MRLKKGIRQKLKTQEGVYMLTKLGFFVWTDTTIEETLKRQHYQMVKELEDDWEYQLSMNTEAIILDHEPMKYSTHYKRGQWNPYGTYQNTPDGNTVWILKYK